MLDTVAALVVPTGSRLSAITGDIARILKSRGRGATNPLRCIDKSKHSTTNCQSIAGCIHHFRTTLLSALPAPPRLPVPTSLLKMSAMARSRQKKASKAETLLRIAKGAHLGGQNRTRAGRLYETNNTGPGSGTCADFSAAGRSAALQASHRRLTAPKQPHLYRQHRYGKERDDSNAKGHCTA